MKLIVGLGNPGPEYARTRHNAGFMVVDQLANRHRLTGVKTKHHAGVLDGAICQQRCLLLQPMTFMNRSGLAVADAVRYYRIDASRELLVVVDDVSLPFGKIRLRASGRCGGHNGLADIERTLGSDQYPRLRIGIDSSGRQSQTDYVLGRFRPEQIDALPGILDQVCDAIECWLVDGIEKAMSRYNAVNEEEGPSNE